MKESGHTLRPKLSRPFQTGHTKLFELRNLSEYILSANATSTLQVRIADSREIDPPVLDDVIIYK